MLDNLDEQGVIYKEVEHQGACVACSAPSTMTARVTPIGLTMVGGADDYHPTCLEHFEEKCLYVNPSNLLAEPR